MWEKGNKVNYRNYVFDSQKEFLFYQRFIEKYDKPDSEFVVLVHQNYDIIEKFEISGLTIRGAKYTPDVVITDKRNNLLHVYDVKNGFTSYAVSDAAKIRFKLFAERYGVPVECVVPRKGSFKVKIFGMTRKTTEHIFKDIEYDWQESV